MIKKPSISGIFALTVGAWLLVATAPAQAYIDPGTGSLYFQGLVGGFAGALLMFRHFKYKVAAFFSRLFTRARQPRQK